MDRLLDKTVGERCEDDCDDQRDPADHPPGAGALKHRQRGGSEHEYRPVPQVESVGAFPDPARDARVKHCANAGSGHHGACDHDRSQQHNKNQATTIDNRGIRRKCDRESDDTEQ